MSKQLSFFDIQPEAGPLSREQWDWKMWYQGPYRRLLQDFWDQYQETPVLWRKVARQPAMLYLTHPQNAFFVHRGNGKLLVDKKLYRKAWFLDLSLFEVDRRKHVSPQVVRLLDGDLSPEDWCPQIAERLRFDQSRQEELLQALARMGLDYCLEKELHQGYITVFGPPREVQVLFRFGWDTGFLISL